MSVYWTPDSDRPARPVVWALAAALIGWTVGALIVAALIVWRLS
jgi:hypothetical protein